MSPLSLKYFSFKFEPKTDNERKWRDNQDYDAMECIFCGNKTIVKDTTMLIQSTFKGRNTSFIEEIQRDMKIAFEKADHIIFMGYCLPSDDISYRSMLASRCQQNKSLKVSVVLYDEKADSKWYEGKELDSYLVNNPNNEAAQNITRIKELLGEGTDIRAYRRGVPNVFLDSNQIVSKEKVLNLINWNKC